MAASLKLDVLLPAQEFFNSDIKRPNDIREHEKQNVAAYSAFNHYVSVPFEVARSAAAYSSVINTYLCADAQPLDERSYQKGNSSDCAVLTSLLLAH